MLIQIAETVAPQTGKTLDRTIIVVLAVAVGFFADDKFVLDPGRDAEIAVAAEGRGRIEAMIESYGDKYAGNYERAEWAYRERMRFFELFAD